MPAESAINDRLQQIQRALPDLYVEQFPRSVYHYTDTRGLLGILGSGELWATSYRVLNDSSELFYTFTLATAMARREFAEGFYGPAKQFFDFVAQASRPDIYIETPYYLCCFSDRDNSLSQWRAYGGNQGFCLQFPGDITPDDAPPAEKQNPALTLLKVHYDLEFQELYVRTLLSELGQLYSSAIVDRDEPWEQALGRVTPFFWEQLNRASYQFKHPDFEEEHEWRLVWWGEVDKELYRDGRTITPYIRRGVSSTSYAQSGGHEGTLPLTAVRHGPSKLPDETKWALKRLLTSHGYIATEPLGSGTPLRT